MSNNSVVPNNAQDQTKSRQQIRAEARAAEKAAEHEAKVSERIDLIVQSQTRLLEESGLPEVARTLLTEFLGELIAEQLKTGIYSDLKGFEKYQLDMIRNYKTSPEGVFAAFGADPNYMKTPNPLKEFISMKSEILDVDGQQVIVQYGKLIHRRPSKCPKCGAKMWKDGNKPVLLHHLPQGGTPTYVTCMKDRYRCCNDQCRHTEYESIPFQAENHRITKPLQTFMEQLLEYGYTNREVGRCTGTNEHLVKEVDLKRLRDKHTVIVNGKRRIKKPDKQAKILMIDEFKLHDGNEMATIIINGETGEALWLEATKSKQVVYDFMEYVGKEWMEGVEAVACDMNADFSDAFREWYPSIKVVFDYFHIVKNFNEKVIAPIRIDEEKRLRAEGRIAEAEHLKRSKYILTASRERLKELDEEAKDGKTTRKASELFGTVERKRQGGKEGKYMAIIAENKLLFACDIVKGVLEKAYSYRGQGLVDRLQMGRCISRIIRICNETKNEHFKWFANMISKHRYGIITHATYPISSGKMEGVNQKIKTVRRIAYGLPDDDYFFLKIVDFTHESGKQKARAKQPSVAPKLLSKVQTELKNLGSMELEFKIA